MPQKRRRFGAVRKLPSKRYQVRYWGPDGRQHSAPYTFTTYTDADRWLRDQEGKLTGETWEPPKVVEAKRVEKVALTVGEYAERALARRKLRDTTRELYTKLLRVAILPKFKDVPLASVDSEMVGDWYASMAATPTQQANAYGLLKSILKDAVDGDLIEKNPCRVKGGSGKTRASEPETLTPDELTAYLAAVPQHYRVALVLAALCGLRSGEVRGLRRSDLDLTTGTLRVQQQAVKVGATYVLTKPKTRAGIRTVKLPPSLVPMLTEWLKTQPVRGRNGLLFTARDGVTPLSASTLRDAHVAGRAAIKRDKVTLHGLRHSAATLAAQNGATTRELMKRFGWDTPLMASHYQHAAEERDAILAEKLDQYVPHVAL